MTDTEPSRSGPSSYGETGVCPKCDGTGSWHNSLEGPNEDWGDCECVFVEMELGPEPDPDPWEKVWQGEIDPSGKGSKR